MRTALRCVITVRGSVIARPQNKLPGYCCPSDLHDDNEALVCSCDDIILCDCVSQIQAYRKLTKQFTINYDDDEVDGS